MKKNLLFILFLLAIFFSLPNFVFSQTGKISGKITDEATNEDLIGVSVLVEGTYLGAATNVDGTFTILNINPGTYNLLISAVGFQKKKITNVRVATNFTTRIDAQLVSDAIGLEEVVVEAERPLIRKDLTSSRTVMDDSQIEALPVESIDQILSLQAGITKGASGELHIRGGRSTEIAFNVNGVSAVNPFDFSRSVQISTNAIKELSVVSGTFNAEYGDALSGVVNTVTKEGGKKYKGTVSYYTGDYFTSNKDVFFNINDINPINNQVIEGTFGGPFPFSDQKVTFFFSGRYNNDQGYLYGQRQHTIYDSVYRNVNNPNDIRLSMTGDNAIVSLNPSEDITSTAKFTYTPIPVVKINYDLIYSQSDFRTYNHELKYNPDANYNRYEWGLINSLELRHALSGTTFYNLSGAFSVYDFKRYLFPMLDASGNAVSFRPGMDLSNLIIDNRYQPAHKNVKVSTYTFSSGGTLNEHFYQRSYTTELKFDITSQITSQHEVKFGMRFKSDQMDFHNFSILRDTITYRTPKILGPETLSQDLYSREPIQFSAYIQDKMEFETMIINAGLRFDYFDSRALSAPNIFEPTANLIDAEAKSTFSPRLGISFPITDRGIIHFSYGHFYQLPPYRFLYTNPNFESFGATPTYGNANLNPEKNVTYEMGLQQQLSDNIAMNITGFYKDVRDLLALQRLRASSSVTYYKYVNKDYGNIKGLTFSFNKRKGSNDLFGASVDYTFQVAEGNETGADAFFLDIASGRQSEKTPVPLNWDQRHTLNGVVTIGTSDDWFVTLVGTIGSGLPYSPELFERQIFLSPNSGRKPMQTNVNLFFEKSYDVFDAVFTVFLKVFNLFDAKNEAFVFDDTGRATYTLEETKGGAQETNNIAARVPGVKTATEYFIRPQYFTAPREIRIGFSFEY